MADIKDFRSVNFTGTGPGAAGAVLLPAAAGRVYKVWKIVSAVGGAVIGNTQTAPSVSVVVVAGTMPYDGSPYFVGQPGAAVYWTDGAAAENLTVFYTLEGGV